MEGNVYIIKFKSKDGQRDNIVWSDDEYSARTFADIKSIVNKLPILKIASLIALA